MLVARGWRRLRRGYTHLMATRWGYNLFGRALPSAFFLVGLLGGLRSLDELLVPLAQQATPSALLAFLLEVLARFTGVAMVVLFAVRKRPIGPPASLLGALVSLSATFYGVFVIFFDTFGLRRPDPTTDPILAGIALALGSAGTCLLALGMGFLGRHLGLFPEVRGLVTGGPYRYLRHPMYTAYLLAAAGALLATLSLASLVLFAVYYGLLAWRAALEERALEQVFGETYHRYVARTAGVVPAGLAAWLRRVAPGG